MKKQYLLTLLFILLLLPSLIRAQETRIIQVDGWDPASGEDPTPYENLLYYAIMNDSTERKTNPNVIFELQRDRIYFLGKQIENYDFHLHIRGKEGSGLPAEIQASVKADGTYGLDYIHAYNDLTLENLAINGYLPDGGYQHWVIECRGKGSTIRYNNVSFDGDRAAAVCARADSLKIFITNCSMGNIGYRTAFGGNGRVIDLRPDILYLDTLVIENSTCYNLSDRIIRNMNTHINYAYINHFTAVNTLGRHGGIQLGDCKNATVKNSLFANVIMLGHTDIHCDEQTQPEDPPHFAVITLDTIYEDGTYIIENNNMYWDNAVTGVWDQIDTVSSPDFVNPLIEDAVAADRKDLIAFSEQLSFTTMCGPQISYVALYYADPLAGTYPDSWCVGGDGGYFPDQIDLSYSASSSSYTAAENGLPVGNLNYFPELMNGINDKAGSIAEHWSSAFPNPFSDMISVAYDMTAEDHVTISVYDLNGRVVKVLNDQVQEPGRHMLTWDGSADNGSFLPGGIYIYHIETTSWNTSGSIVMIK